MLKTLILWAIASGASLTLQPIIVNAESLFDSKGTLTDEAGYLRPDLQPQINYETYILGPGDSIFVEVEDLPELSGNFSIGPDGTIYLPRLRALYVEDLTIEELRIFISEQLKQFVLAPEVFITPTTYRAVRVYVGGEVARPGYYTISDPQVIDNKVFQISQEYETESLAPLKRKSVQLKRSTGSPKLFDALQAAKGVTPFSQLDQVQVTRRRPQSQGGGRIRATVNFLNLISKGDEDVNIRLYDNDSIFVNKSNDVLRDQLLAASRTNLSPDFLQVFVSGRVKSPGPQQLPQGASLNQAIASAGGPKIMRGKVEFLRFSREGSTDRRIFAYSPNAPAGDRRNPILMLGDVVRVNESIATASVELINEITAPAVGIYSVYSIYRNLEF